MKHLKQFRHLGALGSLVGAAGVILLTVLAGCGGSGNNSGNSNPTQIPGGRDALVGTWKAQSVGGPDGGEQADCPAGFPTGSAFGFATYCGASDSLTLNADGTFTRRSTETNTTTVDNVSGTWDLAGDRITLTGIINNASVTGSATIGLSDGGKTLTALFSSYSQVYVKQQVPI
jgi:hypothetical protein